MKVTLAINATRCQLELEEEKDDGTFVSVSGGEHGDELYGEKDGGEGGGGGGARFGGRRGFGAVHVLEGHLGDEVLALVDRVRAVGLLDVVCVNLLQAIKHCKMRSIPPIRLSVYLIYLTNSLCQSQLYDF